MTRRFKDNGYQEEQRGTTKRKLKRQSDFEDDEIEKGGSSQDRFESDFIDDDSGDNRDYNVKSKGGKAKFEFEDQLPSENEEDEYMSES